MDRIYKDPDFSIITITFNNDNLVKTVQSVIELKERSVVNIEHVLINGGSHTELSNLVDSYINEPDGGIYDALNKGLERSNGKFIMFVHADDYIDASLDLDSIALFFKGNPNVDIYLGRTFINSKLGRYHGSLLWRPFLLKAHIQPPHLSAIYRSYLFDNFRFNTTYRIISDFLMFRHFSNSTFKYSRTRMVVQEANGLSSNFVNVTREFVVLDGLRSWLIMPFRLIYKMLLGWI